MNNNAEDEDLKKLLAKTQHKMKIQREEKARELTSHGTELKDAGKLDEAEEIFRDILALTPEVGDDSHVVYTTV